MNPENIMLRNKAATKGSVLYNCTSVRSLENSIQIQRQKAEWWLSGAGGRGELKAVEWVQSLSFAS